MPLVSIVIPTYKRATFLARAIQSCLDQTLSDIEIIVVDDNEENSQYAEETKRIVEEFDGVRYIKNSGNIGGARSRNEGIYAARGQYIAFLDDDDIFLPTKLEEQVKCYEKHKHHNCGMVYCYYNQIYKDGRIVSIQKDVEGCCIYDHLMDNIAMTSSWLCPKDALLSVGGFDDVGCCQEGTLLLKLLEQGYEVFRVPLVLMEMHVHSNNDQSGITNISYNYIEHAKKYEQKCLNAAKELCEKQRKSVYLIKYYWIYNMYYVLRDRKGKKEYLIKMLKVDWAKPITWKAICKYFLNN